MFRKNPMKAKLKAGQQLIGVWLNGTGADNAEVLAHAGLDFLAIDQEHGPGGIPQLVDQLRAMSGTDTGSIVRVPWNDMVYFKKALDAGAEGVIVPMVETAAQARAVVAACTYPPVGIRGAAGGIRGATYGYAKDYKKHAAEELIIAVQVESAAAVERIPDIAAVPGVDMIFIGPRDLSGSIGKLDQFEDPEVKALVRKAEEKILKAGKWLASVSYANTPDKELFERGYHMVIAGGDFGLLGQGAKRILASVGR